MVDRPMDGLHSRTEADTIMTSDTTHPALDADGAAPGALNTQTVAPPSASADAAGTETAKTGKATTGRAKATTAARQPPNSIRSLWAGGFWQSWPLRPPRGCPWWWQGNTPHHGAPGRRGVDRAARSGGAGHRGPGHPAVVSGPAAQRGGGHAGPADARVPPPGAEGSRHGAGRPASTSKTQVVLWTGALVWALVDLLLLARAYPGGSLFINALKTNWHPEYLVLLGLPVAAATTAKAVVAGPTPARARRPPIRPRKRK